jgi:hypothetical protein
MTEKRIPLDWEIEWYEEFGLFADDFELPEEESRDEVPEEQRSWLYDLI